MHITIDLQVRECPPRSLMSLHHELSRLETETDGLIRFCQHINFACWWLAVGNDLYEISAEEFVNAVVNAVMASRDTAEAEE